MTPEPPPGTGLFNEQAFTDTVVLDDDGQDIGLPGQPEAGHEPGIDADERPQWAGKRLGRFKLMRLLGQGGMGVVIQAQDIHLGRIVALKVLRKQIKGVGDRERVDQFLREAKSAARIDHPNAAQVYEINEHKGWWYIASEMIEGGTLQQIVKVVGKLDPAQACPLIADAASVLSAAHQAGVVHRDIKPHNLMLTRLGRCKVVDFGLVRLDDPNDPFDFTKRAVGTPDYLPPEASKRGKPTGAYDVYSLGATLYFALTGRPPFKGQTLRELVTQHTEAPRPDAREHNPNCSARLAELIQHAMAIDPADRPSAADFASALRVESIGGEYNPASLVHAARGAIQAGHASGSHPGDPASGISALPLSTITSPGSRVLGAGPEGTLGVEQHRGRRVWVLRIAAASVVIGLAVTLGFVIRDWYGTPPQVRDRAAFGQRFPNAPTAYGTRQPGAEPPTTDPIDTPPFSWVGRIDPGENAYVSSTRGSRAYPVYHPAARLIPADLARFHRSADEARRAGLTLVEP